MSIRHTPASFAQGEGPGDTADISEPPAGETAGSPLPREVYDPEDRRVSPRVAEIREEATEFEKKYPPDAFGEELSENARIWSIYRDEATEHDNRLIDAWNRSLDILLIFAGLFSAVATAFIIESYQQLQPDWSEYTARLLFVTIAAQAGSPNMTLPTPTELAAMSPSTFSSPAVSRWINGFWVSSLAFSLAVALLSILAKQWLDQYHARTTSPSQGAHDWSRRRALYYNGLKKWHLGTLITMLPALLHASLFLFFLGLILFFWSLDRGVSGCLIVISSCILGFYASSGFLTHWHAECPFYIPLFQQLHRVLGAVDRRSSWWRWALSRTPEAQGDTLDARIIYWLITTSPIQEVVSAAVAALGAVPRGSNILPSLSRTGSGAWDDILAATLNFYTYLHSPAVQRAGQGDLRDAIDPDAPAAYDYYRTGWSLICMAFFMQDRQASDHCTDVVAKNALNAVQIVLYNKPPSLRFHPASAMLTVNAQVLRALHDESLLESARLMVADFNRPEDMPPAPVHVAHTLHMLAALDQKRHVSQFLPAALSYLHRTMRQYGPSATLSTSIDSLRALCVPYHVVGLPELSNLPRNVIQVALSLYCHLISHAADYCLCLDVSSGATRDAFLHEDLTRIARTISELEGIRILPKNAHVIELLACDWFPAMCWHTDALFAFMIQFDYGHAQTADAICNLLPAVTRSNGLSIFFSWVTMLPVNAPKDCLAILDPSRGENGVSVWGTLQPHVIHVLLSEADWGLRLILARDLLSFLLGLAQRLCNSDAAPTGVDVRELFAFDCIAVTLRQLAHYTRGSVDPIEQPWFPRYKDWPLVARSLISEMRQMLPGAWPELRERLLADDGDNLDLVHISLFVQELEVELHESEGEVNASVRES